MQSRRDFLSFIFSSLGTLAICDRIALAQSASTQPGTVMFEGKSVFDRILNKSTEGNWRALPIGELMGKIARELEGTPYVANTLEISPDREKCSANLDGLDCVTFFESTLDLARMIKKGGHTPEDLLREIAFTRYRGGTVGDYTSRLHYTSDWLHDNETKRVVKVLVDLPGASPFTQKVGFMSSHPASYRQLAAHPDLVAKIKTQENSINGRTLKFVPMNKIAAVEPLLRTGDIVGVCTSMTGLDIAHTGIVYRTKNGVAHFMDASSKKARVTLEPGPISQALNWSKSNTGAIFARPLEPR